MQRRQFLQTAATLGVAAAGRVLGANERVGIGLIGCGTRGMALARLLRQLPDVGFVAVCDVYEPHAVAARDWAGGGCRAFADFRKVLDLKEIDAVLVATPDHWHAIPAVLACQAGKDVYVEKPLAHNIREGRTIVAATRKHRRIVQVGTQHRSAEHYCEVQRIVQSGELGKVRFVRVWNYTNLYPDGVGRLGDRLGDTPPPGLDWDFYLGPAPAVPFDRRRFLGTFRWFWDYAGGFITDWGTHRFDTVHQVMGGAGDAGGAGNLAEQAPRSVSAVGGRFELRDGAETPDVLQATYEYPGFVLSYESCQLNGHGTGGRSPGKRYYRARGRDDRPHGEAFYGTNGTLFSDRLGFEIFPELAAGARTRARADQPPALPDKPAGPPEFRMRRKEGAGEDATSEHLRNFIDCVRSRKEPAAPVEIGHHAAIVAHLGNIAYRTGRKLRWDAQKERILEEPAAEELLGRRARKPWDLL